jgi:hypothetical protein
MITGISCGNCLEPIDEPPNTAPSDRYPCPSCGGLTRQVDVLVTDAIKVSVYESQKSKHGRIRSKKRWLPAREIFSGDDLFRITGPWSIVRRIIDRAANWYVEFIYDRETGEILVDKAQPLSEHTGRGSAARSKIDGGAQGSSAKSGKRQAAE